MIVPFRTVPGSTWHITTMLGGISTTASDSLIPDRDLRLGVESERPKDTWPCRLVLKMHTVRTEVVPPPISRFRMKAIGSPPRLNRRWGRAEDNRRGGLGALGKGTGLAVDTEGRSSETGQVRERIAEERVRGRSLDRRP